MSCRFLQVNGNGVINELTDLTILLILFGCYLL